MLLISYLFWIYFNVIHAFLRANAQDPNSLPLSTFYDYIFGETVSHYPWAITFYVLLVVIGFYIAHLLIRPFKKIEKYCQAIAQGRENFEFHLSGMQHKQYIYCISRDFLIYLSYCRRNKRIFPTMVDEQLEKIRAPIFDKVFFVQYFTILMIITGVVAYGLLQIRVEIFESIVSLTKYPIINSTLNINKFLRYQEHIFDSMFTFSCLLMPFFYIMITHYLSRQVVGVSFAFLRDMREIMKGRFNLRFRLRVNDPGHGAAMTLNQLLDQTLTQTNEDATSTQVPPLPQVK
jgi:hypothetical protein